MITELQAKNFKSWKDSGPVKTSAITGLFGTNSSGKTAILQLLLLLKQTVESNDRSRILATDGNLVNLGTLYDIINEHKAPGKLAFSLEWKVAKSVLEIFPHVLPALVEKSELAEQDIEVIQDATRLRFNAVIQVTKNEFNSVNVKEFNYKLSLGQFNYSFGMQQINKNKNGSSNQSAYEITTENFPVEPVNPENQVTLPPPIKSYDFPDQFRLYYQNLTFLPEIVLAFEELFQNIYYLGPLRAYPNRIYTWTGEPPKDVGQRGELTIPALLASRTHNRNGLRVVPTVEERVAEWLAKLGLIYSFKLQPIAENRQEYEVLLKLTANAPEVRITEVGFGVSQILPVLVLCYYAPKGSTILFEQPEIHLHPSVQAGLADVFIDAIKTRNVQIILESHSEHLLHRLQRRIAEEELSNDEVALYFCQTDNEGTSHLTTLQLDEYGNINNWPENFFGDELGDLVKMTEAAMQRQIGA